MFARPKLLSLVTTHRCTAACDHCCFGCSPTVVKAIPLLRMASLIDEAAAIESIETIGFTGGECFLLGGELDALVARATGHGLSTRVVTNGYWAVTPAAARARVATIRAAGLNEMHLSTGMFHARFVPVTRVLNAARAAAEAGLTVSVVIEECEASTFDVRVVRDALLDLTADGRVLVLRQPWIPNAQGSGVTRLTHDMANSRFRPENAGGCESILNVLSVTPDQTLIACCGYTMEAIPDLHLGSVADRGLADVLLAAPNEFLKYWIHVEGPEAVLTFVKRFDPTYTLPIELVDMCQTCLHLHRDERARRVLSENMDSFPLLAVVDAFNARMLAHARLQPRRSPITGGV